MLKEKLAELRAILAEVHDLYSASAVLEWDQQVHMPPGGAEARAEQLSTLHFLAHAKFTAPRVGELLAELEPAAANLEYESDDASLIRVTRREYDHQVKIPGDLVKALSKATSDGYVTWVRAREAKDFSAFRPALAEILNLTIQVTEALGYADCRYDALVDLHEPGLKTAKLDELFAELRETQVPLVQAVTDRLDRVDDRVLHQHYDEAKQLEFTLVGLQHNGFDLSRGRQDKSVHPFCTSFSSDDVRVTTRVWPNFFNAAFFSTLHEGGHGMYEQGIPKELRRTPLGGGASTGIHESQSRLWENIVGRSREYWVYMLPKLREFFPAQLEGQTVDSWYRAINRSQPSLIRVEADELTYNLHIMLRFELERALLDGQLAVKDLPEAWNSKMKSYLGIVPPDDKEGVLQDVHWSGGMIGYFPSYTLGNVISAQLWEAALKDHPEIPQEISQGKTSTLLEWMRRHIHVHGAKLTPSELLRQATGRDMTAGPYLRYLTAKFSELYGL